MNEFGWTGCRNLALRAFLVFGFIFVVKETLWQTESTAYPEPEVSQHVRAPHFGTKVFFRKPRKHAKVMTLADMPDLANATAVFQNQTVKDMTWEEALRGRERVVEILYRAGVRFDLDVLKILPLWSDVTTLYGDEPVVLGLEQCHAFRERFPPERRFAGIAGQHNW